MPPRKEGASNPNEWFVKLIEDAQRKYKEANEYVGEIINSIEFADDAGQETKKGAQWKNEHHLPKRSRACCDFVVPEEEETYGVQPYRVFSVPYEDAPKFGGKHNQRDQYTEESKKALRVRQAGYAYPGHATTRPHPEDLLKHGHDGEGGIFPRPPSYPGPGPAGFEGGARTRPSRRKEGEAENEEEEPQDENARLARKTNADGSVMGDLAEMLS